MKLTPSEQSILNVLIFPELFSTLLEETEFSYGVLRADLIQLISRGYVEVYHTDMKTSLSPFYDSDNISDFAFKATKTGLKAIQKYAV